MITNLCYAIYSSLQSVPIPVKPGIPVILEIPEGLDAYVLIMLTLIGVAYRFLPLKRSVPRYLDLRVRTFNLPGTGAVFLMYCQGDASTYEFFTLYAGTPARVELMYLTTPHDNVQRLYVVSYQTVHVSNPTE